MIRSFTIDNIEDLYSDLAAAYGYVEEAKVCSIPADAPFPGLSTFQAWLSDPRYSIMARYEGDSFIAASLFKDVYKLRTNWGPIHNDAVTGMYQWAEYFESEGMDVHIDTGVPGWVVREFFALHMEQEGPFDVVANSYEQYDDVEWSLRFFREDPDSEWQWEVIVHG
jgi:hypothetical protein